MFYSHGTRHATGMMRNNERSSTERRRSNVLNGFVGDDRERERAKQPTNDRLSVIAARRDLARQAPPPRASNTTTFVTSARRDRPVAPHRRRWNSPRIHSSSSLSSGGRVCSHLRKRYLQVPSHRRHDLVVDPHNLSARVECQVRSFYLLLSCTPLAPLTRPSYLKAPNVEDSAVDSICQRTRARETPQDESHHAGPGDERDKDADDRGCLAALATIAACVLHV